MPQKLPEIPAILQSLSRLYKEIDKEAKRLSQIHASRLRCQPGCADCCIDGLSINEVEAEHIRYFSSALLHKEAPHPKGMCAFLDSNNKCRIYSQRPYVCRTQGLPLHWITERDGKTIALRDICALNDQGTALEELAEDACWKIGPAEDALAKLQYAFNKGSATRVKLRDLFKVKLT